MKDTIKTVLVDDVETMRMVLKKLLSTFDKINVIGEASDFEQALQLIDDERPDLLFLDVDLNGITSIDLLGKINYKPMVIFITSHSDFAIKAFELNAIDYLLKPISLDRLTRAIEKVTNKWENNETWDEEDVNVKFTPEHIILLNFDSKLSFVNVSEINYIEAYGNYTKVYLKDGRLSVTYNSIKNWDTRLPDELFIQIHRSTIINLSNVSRIEKWANDTGRLYLNNVNKPFEISRSYFFQIKKKYKM
ncbi:MAG: LytTR family DNA-binding domain-containing protein [Bacteroidia bacterium]|jgi:two-component system LytT family response regulator|nr:LytTR family DNA-binding domain-containing protein [Bacteroidia bacterium]